MSLELTELVTIPAGTSWMGSDDFYPEEAPRTQVSVEAFQLERHPVTNAQFAAFVNNTGWVTTAERPIPDDVAGIPPELRSPGSLVFTPPSGPVDLLRWELWWRWVPGASWKHPFGPDSDLAGREHHPVVHVSKEDAEAYAAWAERRLPTESEWEHAVASPVGHSYAWGEDFIPDGQLMANTFQGHFPYENTGANGWIGTSPVEAFPATRHGLFDMIGNVWEWTASIFTATRRPPSSCCTPSVDQNAAEHHYVVKGGSHLCNPAYCARYRPAARQPQTPDSATTHLGFRCARSLPSSQDVQ
jgi:formylglycine-generating enzyme required for sulfatase activity